MLRIFADLVVSARVPQVGPLDAFFSAQAAWLPQSPQGVESGEGWDTHLHPRDALLLIIIAGFLDVLYVNVV